MRHLKVSATIFWIGAPTPAHVPDCDADWGPRPGLAEEMRDWRALTVAVWLVAGAWPALGVASSPPSKAYQWSAAPFGGGESFPAWPFIPRRAACSTLAPKWAGVFAGIPRPRPGTLGTTAWAATTTSCWAHAIGDSGRSLRRRPSGPAAGRGASGSGRRYRTWVRRFLNLEHSFPPFQAVQHSGFGHQTSLLSLTWRMTHLGRTFQIYSCFIGSATSSVIETVMLSPAPRLRTPCDNGSGAFKASGLWLTGSTQKKSSPGGE